MSLELTHPDSVWRPKADQESAGTTRFVAPGTSTGGEFGLFHGVMQTGGGAVPHYHEGFSESFYVLEGSLRIRAGDRIEDVGEGDFVHVPPLGIHTFRNVSKAEVRFLMLFVPGAPREGYFHALTEAYADGRHPTDDEIDAIARQHDQINVRDPHWALSTESRPL